MCSNRTENSWRSKFYFIIISLSIVLCFWENVYAENVLSANSSKLKSLTVIYEDGESLEVTKPTIRYISNPGYVPTRWSTCDFLKLVKRETVRNVTTQTEKEVKLSDIASIEFKRDESGYYFGIITLLNGKKLVSRSTVLWDLDDDKTSEEYKGCLFELCESDRCPSLIGSVLINGKKGSFKTILHCPRQKSAENISKIIFNYENSR